MITNRVSKIHLIQLASPIKQICSGCPTAFEFSDKEGHDYYFRLRWGSWYLENETLKEIICSGDADNGLDGICSEDDMLRWAMKQGVFIT